MFGTPGSGAMPLTNPQHICSRRLTMCPAAQVRTNALEFTNALSNFVPHVELGLHQAKYLRSDRMISPAAVRLNRLGWLSATEFDDSMWGLEAGARVEV